jgi:hypothetical protein
MYEYCHVSGVPWIIITGSGLDDWIYWRLPVQSIITAHSQWLSNLLHSLLGYECLLFYYDWLGSDLRIGHLISFCCLLVNTPQRNTQLLNSGLSCKRRITYGSRRTNDERRMTLEAITWPPFITSGWTEYTSVLLMVLFFCVYLLLWKRVLIS